MMRLLSLQLTGFKSFRGTLTTVHFPLAPGFYLLSGKNKQNKRMEGNAVGKSTMWDAVSWVLYGKTLRGTKAGNVVTWGRKGRPGCEVALRFTVGKTEHAAQRSQSPNVLLLRTLSGEWRDAKQEEIDRLVGMNYECFLHCALMGQFNPFFFDLSPADKLSLFSDILGLDVWLKASKGASTLEGDCQSEIEKIESEVQFSQGRIAEQTTQLDAYRQEHKTFLEKSQRNFVQAKKRYARLEKQERKAFEAVQARTMNLDGALQRDDWQKEKEDCERELDRWDRARCPTCGQAIEHTLPIRKKMRKLKKRIRSLGVRLDEYRSVGRTEALADRKGIAENALWDVRTDLESAKRSLVRPKDVFAGKIKLLKTSLADSKYKIERLRETKDKRELRRRAAEYWVKGFKDVRLWLIDQSLQELSIEVNNHLQWLGLKCWSIRFDVERETKSGTISRGFSVFVKAPFVDKEVPWECWSGGETQRLRLAGNAGLASLIRSKTGANPEFEVYDEPEQHLSGQGVTDLLEWLRERSRTERRQVWLVSHRSLNSGEFDREYRVVKSKEGSTVRRIA